MHCTHCGFENPQSMKYCGQCGQSMGKICPKCNFDNPGNFNFCGNCAAPIDRLSPNETPLPPEATKPIAGQNKQNNRLSQRAERRQITVFFCDMVDSTALSEEVDPEDLRDIMRDYRHVCDTAIHHANGYIAQYLGDGILAYFGYPQAHENDAYLAIQAGLGLIRNIRSLSSKLLKEKGISLEVRIGIHTGLVVVGEIGDGDKRSLALGQTPNLAARLQNLAKNNCIIISDATYKLVHHQFELNPLGEHKLKGLSRPVSLYQVAKEQDLHLTKPGYRPSGQTPLIGRRQETALITDRLDQAIEGQGQIVLLSGEAGIGKSRLAQYVRQSIKSDSHYLLDCWGSPYYQNSYLHGVVELIKRVFDINNMHSLEVRLQLIESKLALYDLQLSNSIPLLANLLSIPLPKDKYPNLELIPQQQKQKTLNLLMALIVALAEQRTVVIIVEDLQWIDPTTIELLTLLIEQVPRTNIFVLLTHRLEFVPPWAARSHLTHISVNPLTRRQSCQMINWLTKDKNLPTEVYDEIINKTDGTPIFVEELTQMVLGSNILKEKDDCYELAAPLSSMEIPATLQDSLMAKLDQLGPEKELAQLSSTLGREFGYRLLKAVNEHNHDDFEVSLNRLTNLDLLYRHGLPPEASYTFRHALMQEVAYKSLLKKTRQRYHEHIAQVLSKQFPDMIAESPEIIAHHTSEAGNHEAAVGHWLEAGKKAMHYSANLDAISHFKKGLVCLEYLPESALRIEYDLTINVSLGLAYMMLKGYAASEVEKAFARADTLCGIIGETAAVFSVLGGLWEYYVVRAELPTAFELATKLNKIAEQSNDKLLYLEAQRAMGSTHFWRGQLTNALPYLKRGIGVHLEKSQRRISTQTYTQDTEVASLANASCVMWLLGQQDQALEKSHEALILAKELEHPFTLCYAHNFHSIICQLRGDIKQMLIETKRVNYIAREFEFGFWKELGQMLECWALMQDDPDVKYLKSFEDALFSYRQIGSRLALSYFQALLSELYCQSKLFEPALATIDRALQEVDTYGERFFEAELYRLKAKILITENKQSLSFAQKYLEKAIAMARQSGAISLELRALTDLCRISINLPKSHDIKVELDKLLAQFSEGHSSQDLLVATEISSTFALNAKSGKSKQSV